MALRRSKTTTKTEIKETRDPTAITDVVEEVTTEVETKARMMVREPTMEVTTTKATEEEVVTMTTRRMESLKLLVVMEITKTGREIETEDLATTRTKRAVTIKIKTKTRTTTPTEATVVEEEPTLMVTDLEEVITTTIRAATITEVAVTTIDLVAKEATEVDKSLPTTMLNNSEIENRLMTC